MGIFNWAITKSGRMVGYQRIKEDTKFLLDIPKQYAKGIEESVPDRPLEKLSKEVLDIKKRNFLNLARLSFFIFLLFLGLIGYEFYTGSYISSLGCAVVSSIPAVLVVKYHYYYTVIKKKKLMSIKEYFEGFRKEIK